MPPSWRSLLSRTYGVVRSSYSKKRLLGLSIVALSVGPLYTAIATGTFIGLVLALSTLTNFSADLVYLGSFSATMLSVTFVPLLIPLYVGESVLQPFKVADPKLKYPSLFVMFYIFTLAMFSFSSTVVLLPTALSGEVGILAHLIGLVVLFMFSLFVGYMGSVIGWEQPADSELRSDREMLETCSKLQQKEQAIRTTIENVTGLPVSENTTTSKSLLFHDREFNEDEREKETA